MAVEFCLLFFFFKQKTAYEMRISDWSSDVCSSDLRGTSRQGSIEMTKIKCAIIGPGNIGTDLLYKLLRSDVLEPVWMVGVDPTSEGLARAKDLGLKTTDQGVDGLVPHVEADGIQIAFDATSAYVHADNSRKINALGVQIGRAHV